MSENSNIIIIGAGVAGLAAAQYLTAHGYHPIILEARNYIGGRVNTDHSLGVPFDLGAAWLHGLEGNPIAYIAQQLHIPFSESNFTDIHYFKKDHSQLPSDLLINFRNELFEKLINDAVDYAQACQSDISIRDAVKIICEKENIDFSQELLNWAFQGFSLYMGATADTVSAKHCNDEVQLPGGNYFLTGTYERIINVLSQNLKVELNTIVNKIVYHDKIEIHTDSQVWIADKIIITVPLGTLKQEKITFNPALPDNKLGAIQRLDMGILDKIILKFPKVFWPDDKQLIYLSDLPVTHSSHFINYTHYNPVPLLIGSLAGVNAHKLETLSDQEIITQTMKDLRSYFGNDIPDPEAYVITRWRQDPFSFGSYTYIPVNASSDDFDTLAEPIADKLFFAGEATHRQHFATVHGAYFSGIREARRIINT